VSAGQRRSHLPEDVTSTESLTTFRRLLKTHLFRMSFPDYLLDINWLSPVDLAVVPLLRPPKNSLFLWLIDSLPGSPPPHHHRSVHGVTHQAWKEYTQRHTTVWQCASERSGWVIPRTKQQWRATPSATVTDTHRETESFQYSRLNDEDESQSLNQRQTPRTHSRVFTAPFPTRPL